MKTYSVIESDRGNLWILYRQDSAEALGMVAISTHASKEDAEAAKLGWERRDKNRPIP